MLIGLNEVSANDCSEELRRRDRMLLCQDVNGILYCVCGNNNPVVGFSVSVSCYRLSMEVARYGGHVRFVNIAF